MRKLFVIILCCSLLLGLVSCAPRISAKILNEELTQEEAKDFTTTFQISSETVEGLNQFAYEFYEKLADGSNIFFSPYSISIALSMLTNGAEGETKAELEELLGIADLDSWNAELNYLMASFLDEKAVVTTANSIWWDSDKTIFNKDIEKRFFQPTRFYYNADLYQADFSKDSTVEEVNDWISRKTDKMIPKMVEKFDQDTVMCLINAIYFNGIWTNKFTHEGTYKQEFYGKSKTTKVDMMHQGEKNYKYITQGEIQALELPYGSGGIAMDILMPTEDSSKTITELFGRLTAKEKDELFATLSNAEPTLITSLALPKFTMEYEVKDMKDIMMDLGMVTSFDSVEANFEPISDSVYVSEILHKAKIEVDEEGSKAAAATVIMMTESAMLIDNIINFIVDQPFIFVIRDVNTGVILFFGEINDLN